MEDTIKLVIVGDGAVGKTCLLIVYAHPENSFPEDYVPTIFDNYNCDVEVNGKNRRLSLWDTAGQEEFDELRPLSYTGTDVFLVCYNVTEPVSLGNVRSKWVPELKRCCGGKVKFVLVGTQNDLRNEDSISVNEGRNAAKKLGAYAHMVCSAKTNDGVKEVFDEAIMCHLNQKKKSDSCTIL